MRRIYKSSGKEGYQAYINGGCMNYRDALGAYRIPLGSRSHFCLLKLEDSPQNTRSLEIDLLTGNVYYRVENHTETGLAYYYDAGLSKVWNNRILRLLHSIRDEKCKPDPALKRAIQKLPCPDWEEVLLVVPGFAKALQDRYDRLFLPYAKVETIHVDRQKRDLSLFQTKGTSEPFAKGRVPDSLLLWESIPGAGRKRTYRFDLRRENGTCILRYVNENIGAEFFDEDEAYERVLTDPEARWVGQVFSQADPADEKGCPEIRRSLIRFLRRELEISY